MTSAHRTRPTQRFLFRSKLRIQSLLVGLMLLVSCNSTWQETAVHQPPHKPRFRRSRRLLRAIPSPTPDPDIHVFGETERTVRGVFRQFWEREGGLARFGLPLTEEIPVDGVLGAVFRARTLRATRWQCGAWTPGRRASACPAADCSAR